MPKVYQNDNELGEAFLKIVSAIRDEFKDLSTGGSDWAITGHETSMNIVPTVTGMYKTYAEKIRQVCLRHKWTLLHV